MSTSTVGTRALRLAISRPNCSSPAPRPPVARWTSSWAMSRQRPMSSRAESSRPAGSRAGWPARTG